jgi:hypothetical protein
LEAFTMPFQRFSDFRPTSFDPKGIGVEPNRENWLVLPWSITRDSGPYTQSNFYSALEALGGESDTVEVHRFGHWGPGWFEIIIIHPSREDEAQELADAYDEYSVLDDDDLSRREMDAWGEAWESWGARDFAQELAKAHGLDPFILDDIPADALAKIYCDNASDPYGTEGDGEPYFPGMDVAAKKACLSELFNDPVFRAPQQLGLSAEAEALESWAREYLPAIVDPFPPIQPINWGDDRINRFLVWASENNLVYCERSGYVYAIPQQA